MDLILKIDDEAVDLGIETVVAITKQAAKIGDVSSVLADGTNEFSLPLTPKNKTIFENADVFQADTTTPYQRLMATLIQQGVETIQNGFAVLNKVAGNFEIQVVGGNASFFNLIKELSLKDLNLTSFDHFWTNDLVFANRNNSTGFIYSLFEQSSSEQETPLPTLDTYGANLYAVRTNLLMASMFIDTLIEKIFSDQNFTFSSDVTGLDIWLKQTLFNAEGWNRGTDSTYLNVSILGNSDVDLDTDFISQSLFVPLIYDGSITNQQTNYWDETTLNSDLLQGVSSGGLGMVGSEFSKLSLPDATRVTGIFNFTIENTNIGVPIQLSIRAVHSNSGMASTVETRTYLLDDNSLTDFSETFEFDVTKSDGDIYFSTGETACLFFVYATYSGAATLVTMKAGGASNLSFEFISAYDVAPVLPYNYLRGISMVPDILQGDLLKEMAKEFDLIFDTDNVSNVVSAVRLDQVRENIPTAIDMSGKLHFPVPDGKGMPTMTFRLGEYAQNNILKWLGDDVTDYNGQGSILIGDTTLDGEKTIVEMKFAASSTVLRFDTVASPYVPIFSDGLPNNGLTNRLMMVKRVTFPYNINFNRDGVDLPTDDVSFSYFSEPGNEDSLDFPTLIDRFFNTLTDMLTNTKVIDCLMDLDISDVKDYSPFTPVYLSAYNSYFYWQKIENYVPGKLTKCKFIKI
jgi:hypothetical protein